MAGQKARPAGRAKSRSGGTTARSSGASVRDSTRPTQATPVRSGKSGRADAGPDGPGRNGGRGQGNRGPGGRPQGGPAAQRRARTGMADSFAVNAEDGRFSVPAWAQWSSLALSLAGLGMSIYLTIAHYTSTSILACSDKGYVDCAKVTTSPESMVFGVLPVAVLGLAFYVFMTAVNTPWGWRWRFPLVWWARLGSIVVGIGFVLYLVYAEIIQIGNICLLCTTVHLITFLLFVVLVFATSLRSGDTAGAAR